MPSRRSRCWTRHRRATIERFFGVFALLLVLVFARAAHAESVRVAVIHPARQNEQARRVRAELSAAGFDAVDVLLAPGEEQSSAQIAQAFRAVSALRTRPDGDLDLLIIDPETGGALQSVVMHANQEPAELALRAVEDLRARLVELAIVLPPTPTEIVRAAPKAAASNGSPPVGQPPGMAERRRLAATNQPPGARESAPPHMAEAFRVWLQGAAGAAVSAGGLGPGAVSVVGVRAEPAGRWSVSCRAQLPLSGQKLAKESGAVTVDAHLVTGAIGFALIQSPVLQLELGLGGGAGLFRMSGVPALPGDEGRVRSRWASIGFSELALAADMSRWLRLRATVQVGATAPRPVIQVQGEEVGSWGRPFGAATLGIEFDALSAVRGPR